MTSIFQTNLQQTLITISQSEQKMESYRQLLNQQIQFNIKDLYMLISGNSSQVTAFHLHVFINQDMNEGVMIDIGLIESMIKSYNNCTSMNLSFIEFALIFLSKENRLLAKLTIQRNSLGDIPAYLLGYVKKILILQAELHRMLIQFRRKFSSAAEQWIKDNSIMDEEIGEEVFDEEVFAKICEGLQIQKETVIRYLKVSQNEPVKTKKMLSVFTIKNCQKLSEYLKKLGKTQIATKNTPVDPFIRPEFHDCLERPKTLQNFSHREIKSIQKHLQRLNSKSKANLSQKISNYRTYIQKQLLIMCQSINKIIDLQSQIESQRIQLCLCTDFYPVLFYESFNKDRQNCLIPSSFQTYLQNLGVKIELNHLYVIFKRYSTRADGKLNFNQFCSIFDVYNTKYSHIQKNRLVKTLEDIDTETVKTFLKLIKTLVKNQLKIEKIKAKLQTQVDLRQMFSIFDEDEDGYISMIDFRVVWKKHILMDLKEDKIGMLWYRMRLSKNVNNMAKYEKFIAQMTPKSPWVEKQAPIKMKTKLKTIK